MATYINLDNLARYDANAKDRAGRLYADASAACWQKTEKAGAVTCVPAPETPLEPVVEFLFKETLPSGTKGAGNPSVIEGVEAITCTRRGRNLCPVEYTSSTMQSRGITASKTSDGYGWHFSGTASSSASPFLYFMTSGGLEQWPEELERGKTYLFSIECADSNVSLQVYDSNSSSAWGSPYEGKYIIHTMQNDGKSFILRIQIARGATVDTDAYLHVEEIDHLVPFEPYARNDYAINLNGTFYGGALDVASGKLTVTHRMVEPSSGTVDISDRPALLPLEYTDTYGRTITSADGTSLDCGSSGGQIVYRLASHYTVYVNPVQIDSLPALDKASPRVNTVYTDALNVQVGYAEHPAYTEELINNAILALGGNV